MLYSNKISVKLADIETLGSDFDFFVVQRDSSEKTFLCFRDRRFNDFNFVSVINCWKERQQCIMFRKEDRTSIHSFRDAVREADGGSDSRSVVSRVHPSSLKAKVLAQLLFGALASVQEPEGVAGSQERFFLPSNCGGMCLYVDVPGWWHRDGSFHAIEIVLTDADGKGAASAADGFECQVNLAVRTFTPLNNLKDRKYLKYTQYIFDPVTSMLRQKRARDRIDGFDSVYVKKGDRSAKSSVTYLDLAGPAQFSRSKAGVLLRLLDDVNRKLGKYVEVRLCQEVLPWLVAGTRSLFKHDDAPLHAVVSGRRIALIDEIRSDDGRSSRIMSLIQDELTRHGVDAAPHDGPAGSGFCIRLIHEKEAYEKSGQPDIHDADFGNMIVQHLTLEGAGEAILEEDEKGGLKKTGSAGDGATVLRNVVKRLLAELVFKEDVQNGKVGRLFDMERICGGKTWSFVTRTGMGRDGGDDGHAAGDGNELPQLCRLTIDAHGGMAFDFPDDGSDDWETIKIKFAGNRGLQEVFYSDIGSLLEIHETQKRCLPDIYAIREAFGAFEDFKRKMAKGRLKEALLEFLNSGVVPGGRYDSLVAALDALEEQGIFSVDAFSDRDRKAMRAVFKEHHVLKLIDQKFNRFLFERDNVWFLAPVRQNLKADQYLLANALFDILYLQKEDGSVEYRVGGSSDSSPKQKYERAFPVREIRSSCGPVSFESDVLPFLMVGFVRNGSCTVRPFPFKYLREYLNLQRQELKRSKSMKAGSDRVQPSAD